MTIHNERVIVVLEKNHAIKSATVFPIDWTSDTEARPLAPYDLSTSELTDLMDLASAATVAERNTLAADKAALESQLTTITVERDSLLERVADRDSLSEQVSTLTQECADAMNQAEQLQATIVSQATQIEQLRAQLDVLLNPPGPDLNTIGGVKQYLSTVRFNRETGGLSIEGQSISTERDEIGHWFPRYYDASQWLAGEATVRAINPDGIYPYKPKHGQPTVLSAAQVVRAYHCLAWYINACFATETQFYQTIEAGNLNLQTIVEHINQASNWPQTQFTWQPPA